MNEQLNLGNRRLVGQQQAREKLVKIIERERLSHAYLFTGPQGCGKKALALAFAEVINGIENLSDLGDRAESKKSSWFTHPDVHMFLPIPTHVTLNEMRSRLEMLKEDPYDVVDFSIRPSLENEDSTQNKRTFYPIDYFRDTIRPAALLKPNEGRKTVIILDEVDRMRTEAANAFLKLLEEPAPNLMFILTSSHQENLLPTITSRCQIIQMPPLRPDEVEEGLMSYDGKSEEDAAYLARISRGNYSLTRFYDTQSLKETRKEVIGFLRHAYQQNAPGIISAIEKWNAEHNNEGLITLLNILETFIRDLMVYRVTGSENEITNIDQLKVIHNFTQSLQDARLDDMIVHVGKLRAAIYQNVQFKYIATALAFRFAALMRGKDPYIPNRNSWMHLPAVETDS